MFRTTLENFHFFVRKCGSTGTVSSYWIIPKHTPPKLSSLITFPMTTPTSFSVLLDNEGEIIIAYNQHNVLYFVLGPWFHAVFGSPGISTLIFFLPLLNLFRISTLIIFLPLLNIRFEKNVAIRSSLFKLSWSWLHHFHVAKRFSWLYKSLSSLSLPPVKKSCMNSCHSSSCNSDKLQWNHFTYLLILHWVVVEGLFQIAHCLIMV